MPSPPDPWKLWKETAPPEAQVALDMAMEGLAREPKNVGFYWARGSIGEKGIPPILEGHVGRSLVLGVSWEALIQAEGDVKKILVDFDFPTMIALRPGTVNINFPYPTYARLPTPPQPPPACDVTLTKPYKLGAHPVTQRLYRAVMGSNPARNQENDQNSVEQVSWVECVRFCNRLSVLLGLPPAYQVDRPESQVPRTQKGGRVFRPVIKEDPHKVPEVVWTPGPGFRLPTDAEWVYAAMAGRDSPLGEDDINDVAWHAGNSDQKTKPIGLKKPNAWGFYDMVGNVGEWVFDAHGYPTPGHFIDYVSTDQPSYRAYRGHGARYSGEWMPNLARQTMRPTDRSDGLGFRLARTHV